MEEMKPRSGPFRVLRASVATAFATTAVIVPGPWATAAVTPVDCPADDLQAAINAAAGGDTLQISGTCTGNFTITSKSLILQGVGDAIITANGSGRPLTIHDTLGQTVTVNDLLVTGGNLSGVVARGGGILADGGSLVLNRSAVADNTLSGGASGAAGAGIWFQPTLSLAGQTLVLTDTTVSDNIGTAVGAALGGGVFVNGPDGSTVSRSTLSGNSMSSTTETSAGGAVYELGGALAMTNSTMSENTVGTGVGIANGGGIYTAAGGSLTSSTVADNTATGALGQGGGVFLPLGGLTLTLTATILGGNSAATGPDCSTLASSIQSGDHNVISASAGCAFSSQPGDVLDQDPQLGRLINHGGGTLTHFLPLGSPARDLFAGPCPVATDQRGIHRPQLGECDSGAFEVSAGFPDFLCTVFGTAGADVLSGTSRNDTVCGFDGSDVIVGGARHDLLVGGERADALDGAVGNDVLKGKKGGDSLIDGTGADDLHGGYGSDDIDSLDGLADDTIDGGRGIDSCTADPGDSVTDC
jgi:hypothetical protein